MCFHLQLNQHKQTQVDCSHIYNPSCIDEELERRACNWSTFVGLQLVDYSKVCNWSTILRFAIGRLF